MNPRIRKSFVFALAAILLFSLLTACSPDSKKEEAGPGVEASESTSNMVSDKPVTFTMLYSDNASYPFNEDWLVLTEMEKLTNVKLDVQVVPESDFDTKMKIVFNSGNIPNIVTKMKRKYISDYVLDGLFLPINEYMDRMPNFSKFVKDYNYSSEIESLTESDGNFYIMPTKAGTEAENTHQWLARIDLFEKHGMPVPTTLEEVYETGKKLKELYPDSNPIINRFGTGNILEPFAEGYGTAAGWGMGNSGFMFDDKSKSFIFGPGTDNYKEMLMYTNKLYKDGVLDKEFATLDSTMYEQRVINSEAFILFDWAGNELRYNAAGKKLNPDFEVKPIMSIKGPESYAAQRTSRTDFGWAIPSSAKKSKNFDTLLKYLDWLYTDEAAVLQTFGVEGKSYSVLDDGVLDYLPEFKGGDYKVEFGAKNVCFDVRVHEDWFLSAKGAETAALFKEMNAKGVMKPLRRDPKLTTDEKDVEKMYSTVVKDYIDEMTEKFIYGMESFDNYDEFVMECYEKGATELEKLYNDSL